VRGLRIGAELGGDDVILAISKVQETHDVAGTLL
jgi:hypothetical protein